MRFSPLFPLFLSLCFLSVISTLPSHISPLSSRRLPSFHSSFNGHHVDTDGSQHSLSYETDFVESLVKGIPIDSQGKILLGETDKSIAPDIPSFKATDFQCSSITPSSSTLSLSFEFSDKSEFQSAFQWQKKGKNQRDERVNSVIIPTGAIIMFPSGMAKNCYPKKEISKEGDDSEVFVSVTVNGVKTPQKAQSIVNADSFTPYAFYKVISPLLESSSSSSSTLITLSVTPIDWTESVSHSTFSFHSDNLSQWKSGKNAGKILKKMMAKKKGAAAVGGGIPEIHDEGAASPTPSPTPSPSPFLGNSFTPDPSSPPSPYIITLNDPSPSSFNPLPETPLLPNSPFPEVHTETSNGLAAGLDFALSGDNTTVSGHLLWNKDRKYGGATNPSITWYENGPFRMSCDQCSFWSEVGISVKGTWSLLNKAKRNFYVTFIADASLSLAPTLTLSKSSDQYVKVSSFLTKLGPSFPLGSIWVPIFGVPTEFSLNGQFAAKGSAHLNGIAQIQFTLQGETKWWRTLHYQKNQWNYESKQSGEFAKFHAGLSRLSLGANAHAELQLEFELILSIDKVLSAVVTTDIGLAANAQFDVFGGGMSGKCTSKDPHSTAEFTISPIGNVHMNPRIVNEDIPFNINHPLRLGGPLVDECGTILSLQKYVQPLEKLLSIGGSVGKGGRGASFTKGWEAIDAQLLRENEVNDTQRDIIVTQRHTRPLINVIPDYEHKPIDLPPLPAWMDHPIESSQFQPLIVTVDPQKQLLMAKQEREATIFHEKFEKLLKEMEFHPPSVPVKMPNPFVMKNHNINNNIGDIGDSDGHPLVGGSPSSSTFLPHEEYNYAPENPNGNSINGDFAFPKGLPNDVISPLDNNIPTFPLPSDKKNDTNSSSPSSSVNNDDQWYANNRFNFNSYLRQVRLNPFFHPDETDDDTVHIKLPPTISEWKLSPYSPAWPSNPFWSEILSNTSVIDIKNKNPILNDVNNTITDINNNNDNNDNNDNNNNNSPETLINIRKQFNNPSEFNVFNDIKMDLSPTQEDLHQYDYLIDFMKSTKEKHMGKAYPGLSFHPVDWQREHLGYESTLSDPIARMFEQFYVKFSTCGNTASKANSDLIYSKGFKFSPSCFSAGQLNEHLESWRNQTQQGGRAANKGNDTNDMELHEEGSSGGDFNETSEILPPLETALLVHRIPFFVEKGGNYTFTLPTAGDYQLFTDIMDPNQMEKDLDEASDFLNIKNIKKMMGHGVPISFVEFHQDSEIGPLMGCYTNNYDPEEPNRDVTLPPTIELADNSRMVMMVGVSVDSDVMKWFERDWVLQDQDQCGSFMLHIMKF